METIPAAFLIPLTSSVHISIVLLPKALLKALMTSLFYQKKCNFQIMVRNVFPGVDLYISVTSLLHIASLVCHFCIAKICGKTQFDTHATILANSKLIILKDSKLAILTNSICSAD